MKKQNYSTIYFVTRTHAPPYSQKKTGCLIKRKLLRYFQFSALVTYFCRIPSASISMSGILSFYEKTKRGAAKTSFATPPMFIILHHRKSVCSEVNLQIRG